MKKQTAKQHKSREEGRDDGAEGGSVHMGQGSASEFGGGRLAERMLQ